MENNLIGCCSDSLCHKQRDGKEGEVNEEERRLGTVMFTQDIRGNELISKASSELLESSAQY